jgi:alkylation response protein AidB-like acyl-CoA dehydrogenase
MTTDFGRARLSAGNRLSFDEGGRAKRAKQLLAEIRKLGPGIAARSAEIERERQIPRDLMATLKSVGVFRMLVPASHGGFELDLPAALDAIEALARIDGSVGWAAMIGSVASILATLLPRETYDRIYRDGPDVVIAGSNQPGGTAEAVPGGWRMSGRWPLASGCVHAAWMLGTCIVTEGGKPLLGKDGRPQMRSFGLPAADWQIEDTWFASGLKGTASHHIVLMETVVPAANVFDFEEAMPCVPGLIYRTVPQILPILHGPVGVGIAEAALDDLLAHVAGGRQQFQAAVPMRESETLQFELGRVTADLKAAQALHRAQAASQWKQALTGVPGDQALFVENAQASAWVTTACVRVVDACFALAGTSAIYDNSPLQRRLRDIHTAAQHFTVQQRHYAAAGRIAVDQYRQRSEARRHAAE